MSDNKLQDKNEAPTPLPSEGGEEMCPSQEAEIFRLDWLIRENIKSLAPYTTARHEFTGHASVMLDANENAIGSPVILETEDIQELLNRYPDPLQMTLKKRISEIKGIPVENIFAGNGSDEAIDVLIRIFCEPGFDNIIILPPTYGMYSVCAAINNVKVHEVPLDSEYQLDIQAIADAVDDHTKIIFICSPNNPTGNSIRRQDIEIILNNFDGIVVIDEAYINYAKQKSFANQLMDYPNLVVMQTLSKAWGMAALRVGLAYASKEIIHFMNNVKYPYNINEAAQQLALQGLKNVDQVNEWTRKTVEQRAWLEQQIAGLSFTEKIYPSDANFILVKMNGANEIFKYLQTKGIIVRNRSTTKGCEGCLRITVGTEAENIQLIEALKSFSK